MATATSCALSRVTIVEGWSAGLSGAEVEPGVIYGDDGDLGASGRIRGQRGLGDGHDDVGCTKILLLFTAPPKYETQYEECDYEN